MVYRRIDIDTKEAGWGVQSSPPLLPAAKLTGTTKSEATHSGACGHCHSSGHDRSSSRAETVGEVLADDSPTTSWENWVR